MHSPCLMEALGMCALETLEPRTVRATWGPGGQERIVPRGQEPSALPRGKTEDENVGWLQPSFGYPLRSFSDGVPQLPR